MRARDIIEALSPGEAQVVLEKLVASGERVRKKAEEYGVTYPIINGDYYLRKDFGGIRVVPTTLVINQDGKIYKNYLGYREKEIIEEDLQGLLGACEEKSAEKSEQ